MKKFNIISLLLIILFVFESVSVVSSQNLIKNPSFENLWSLGHQPTKAGMLYCADGWTSHKSVVFPWSEPSGQGTTGNSADWFLLSNNNIHLSNMAANSGIGYAGYASCEWFAQQLSSPLKPRTRYRFSMYVRAAPTNPFIENWNFNPVCTASSPWMCPIISSGINLFFDNKKIQSDDDDLGFCDGFSSFTTTPQTFKLPPSALRIDPDKKAEWQRLEANFITPDRSDLNWITFAGLSRGSYTFVDDIELIEDSNCNLCSTTDERIDIKIAKSPSFFRVIGAQNLKSIRMEFYKTVPGIKYADIIVNSPPCSVEWDGFNRIAGATQIAQGAFQYVITAENDCDSRVYTGSSTKIDDWNLGYIDYNAISVPNKIDMNDVCCPSSMVLAPNTLLTGLNRDISLNADICDKYTMRLQSFLNEGGKTIFFKASNNISVENGLSINQLQGIPSNNVTIKAPTITLNGSNAPITFFKDVTILGGMDCNEANPSNPSPFNDYELIFDELVSCSYNELSLNSKLSNSPIIKALDQHSKETIEEGASSNVRQINLDYISVIPNPNLGSFEMVVDKNNVKTGHITIYDILGKVVFEQDVNKLDFTTKFSDFNVGVYLLVFKHNNKIINKKIIIAK